MSFRFQKRIKILPGLRLNVSKTGISWTVGTRGASVTARDSKLTSNVGLPGTGLSYRKRVGHAESPGDSFDNSLQQQSRPRSSSPLVTIFILGVIVGVVIGVTIAT